MPQKKGFARSDRVVEQIRRELAELIRLEVKDPRVGMITLTAVEITPDYTHAKVYYTTLADAAQREQLEKGLARSSGFLRRELGKRVRIHHTPELHFTYDASVERGSELSRLIDEAVASDRNNQDNE
ncbi:MAG TPA: 30S ribosome-binding factor RbfA [Rhodocyclaceae bacterium]|nr:30S ribosome-binding factor RbfA [Rhodocyclaceae bacterium]